MRNRGALRRQLRGLLNIAQKSRVRIFENPLTVATGNRNYKLLHCDDDPDYDLTTNGNAQTLGTDVAECKPKSRITSIDLQLTCQNIDAVKAVEWILVKDPDLVLAGIGYTPSSLFTADVSSLTIPLRKYTLAYGYFAGGSNTDIMRQRIRIKRKALARAGVMNDLDELRLMIVNNNVTDDLTVYCVGTITWA